MQAFNIGFGSVFTLLSCKILGTFVMWRLLVLILAAFIALIAGRVATAQKTAFTADGVRVYLFTNGTWSTDPAGGRSGSGLLELALREAGQSVDRANRCTLIFGLGNGFEVDLKKVELEVQLLDGRGAYRTSRRATIKNPRTGKVRFAEAALDVEEGCAGFKTFEVVDVATC
ncbi:MAG: hypothetical protein CME02_09035 [Geminicoccus sp.]|nr:hypothetical protein [Geminicoccus sp.]